MILRLSALAIAATLLSSTSLVLALSAAEIPSDLPVSSLLQAAGDLLKRGDTNDALTYYDVAISRDPKNYLTFFKRGATYLSLGLTDKAEDDFNKVLEIKPNFEGALLQRARIKSKFGNWEAARKDFIAAGKKDGPEIAELQEAEGAATLAFEAEKKGKWEDCVEQAGTAIMIASKSLALRQTRVHCRFERGEVQEGISDLAHVLQMQPGLTEPHLQISSILFYALRDTDRGLAQIKKCLHSDPDSKKCSKLFKREKQIKKTLDKIEKYFEKKQFNYGVKLLVQTGEDQGLIADVKDDVQQLREEGIIPATAPTELVSRVVEMTCEAYFEMNNHKRAKPFCDEALSLYEHSLHGLLEKSHQQLELENFDAAVATLKLAKEHHPHAQQIQGLLQKAETLLKRSKNKDYYKVLGVPNDADERQIKAAWRKMTKLHHPDKTVQKGMSKEDAEKKMASINEAYEVLSDPELRARFDRGDDPNSNERQQGHPFHGSPFGGGGQQFMFQQGGGFPGGGFAGGGREFKFSF